MQTSAKKTPITFRHTDIIRPVILDQLSQLQIPSNHRYLIRCLVGVIQGVPVAPPEKELPRARLLPIHSTHMKGRIPRSVPRVHIRSIEQEMLQMLSQTIFASLL